MVFFLNGVCTSTTGRFDKDYKGVPKVYPSEEPRGG